jgi:hypothetical protein
MTWRPASLLLVTAVVFPLLLSCSDEARTPPPGNVAYYEVTGPQQDRQTEELVGTLVEDAGCTYLERRDGTRVVPIFPDVGISWDDEGLSVGNNEYPLNAGVSLGGGGAGPESFGVVPSACAAGAAHFVVQ